MSPVEWAQAEIAATNDRIAKIKVDRAQTEKAEPTHG
jgi:hypothetical protein